MEKVIQYLDDIEEKASSIVERASEEKKQMNAILESDIRIFEQEVLQTRTSQIAELKLKLEETLQKELSSLEEDCNKQLKDTEQNVAKNREAIVEKLFQSIINN